MQGALRSLLVTDIVGSTRLWAEYESAMALDLVSHDEIVNTAIAFAGGRVFKHTGDGVMATFESAAPSAAAAAEIQRALGAHAWQVPEGIRVRVALHSGSVHERDGDLFGPPVNRLARLLSRCPAGAVIVSEATGSLLADGIPSGLALREIGRVELRDLGPSETVHCLIGEGLDSIELPMSVGPASTRAGSLPPIDDDLVGRTSEIAAVLDAVDAHPIVSIVGVGGMGKTRLALESATAAGLADGACWCDLTAATSPEAVPATVLAAIGGAQVSGLSPSESVVAHLADRHALVVFDNCEHVVDAARALVGAIRSGCAKVRVLATSREALGLRGEHVIALSSLPVADAIGLFCTRAGEARADLVFDDPTLATIDEICTRLDGIPLAIELAAARCRAMAPSEIAARLDDRFRLLRGGRGGVERHRTLQAAVEWSYSLFEDDERALFDRMAVFAGGALIDAVAAVGDVDEYDALDILDRLIARSMVVATDTELGTRYRQLETLRQYAEDRLVERGLIEGARDRHLEWARTLSAWFGRCHLTSAEVSAFRRYVAEIDNLRAAVRYAVTEHRYPEACEVIAGIGVNAALRPTFEVADWFDASRLRAEQWTDEIASAAGLAAELSLFAGNGARVAELLSAVPESYKHNVRVRNAAIFHSLWLLGDFEDAEARLTGLASDEGADALVVASMQGQVFQTRLHADRQGDADYARTALAHCELLVARLRELHADLVLTAALIVQGWTLDGSGDIEGAIVAASEAIELSERAGAGFVVDAARSLLVYAITQRAMTDPGQRRDTVAMLRAAFDAALKRRNHFTVADFLGCAVERVLWDAGDHRTAALLGRFGRFKLPTNALLPSAVDPALLDASVLAAIEAEAARLDFETAGAIGLAALDRILATTIPD